MCTPCQFYAHHAKLKSVKIAAIQTACLTASQNEMDSKQLGKVWVKGTLSSKLDQSRSGSHFPNLDLDLDLIFLSLH